MNFKFLEKKRRSTLKKYLRAPVVHQEKTLVPRKTWFPLLQQGRTKSSRVQISHFSQGAAGPKWSSVSSLTLRTSAIAKRRNLTEGIGYLTPDTSIPPQSRVHHLENCEGCEKPLFTWVSFTGLSFFLQTAVLPSPSPESSFMRTCSLFFPFVGVGFNRAFPGSRKASA